MVARARQIEIENAVVELLEEYGLDTYPISIRTILETLQIDLIPYSILDNRENNSSNTPLKTKLSTSLRTTTCAHRW